VLMNPGKRNMNEKKGESLPENSTTMTDQKSGKFHNENGVAGLETVQDTLGGKEKKSKHKPKYVKHPGFKNKVRKTNSHLGELRKKKEKKRRTVNKHGKRRGSTQ